ncbi:MAG: GatB/YqeY domain-containing protein [Candidatus Shapirobacteria bacterium]
MLRNKIKIDADEALRMGDTKKVGALRYLISIIDKKALTLPPDTLTEKEELQVLQKELKNKQEAKEMFAKAVRSDLVAEQEYEIEILKKYLPEAMDEFELEKIVDEVLRQAQDSSFGNIMREVGKLVAGRADGGQISQIVKIKLS